VGRYSLPYTRAELNRIIDSILHPWFREYPWLRLVDGIMHALVEQNPSESLEKFLRYHGAELVEEVVRWLLTRELGLRM
jgi:hypothetical protein